MAVRKPIADLIEELRSWLPNYDHGPADYPTLLWRILASTPGGDQAEDMGYEPFQLGWQEIDQLGRMLVAIQDKRDVEELIAGLIEDAAEVEEGHRRARASAHHPIARTPRRPARRPTPPPPPTRRGPPRPTKPQSGPPARGPARTNRAPAPARKRQRGR